MLVSKEEVELQTRYFLPILKEAIFIHPTDVVYGIGCDARNTQLVMQLRLLKKWQTNPFTVIAPSKEWIRENLHVPEEALEQLPGPVTIIARLKDPSCVCKEVHLGHNTLGVRIPDHWIAGIIQKLGIPVVSSCANKFAEDLMTSIDNADKHLIKASKVVLHEGPKRGKPMVFIDYSDGGHVFAE